METWLLLGVTALWLERLFMCRLLKALAAAQDKAISTYRRIIEEQREANKKVVDEVYQHFPNLKAEVEARMQEWSKQNAKN